MKLKWFKIYFIAYALIITFIVGCGPMASQVVMLSRDNYVSKINPDDYKVFQGKRILFHSIIDKSTNTSNLAYYNPERTVGYSLYYKSPGDGWAQPVVSFFWYALKKGFDHAGIIIEESSPIYDAELTIIFRSVTDREIKFDVIFTKMGKLYYEKNYSVKNTEVETTDNAVLEKRAYGMLDSMVKAILDDINSNKEFSISEKGSIFKTTEGDNDKIKGVVLQNGNIIEGQIISMNTETVKICTKDGRILTYSFVKDIKTFLK